MSNIINIDFNVVIIRMVKDDREIIVGLLKKNRGGLTITNLVSMSKLSRSLIRTILARLEGAKEVSIRKVGMAKVYTICN